MVRKLLNEIIFTVRNLAAISMAIHNYYQSLTQITVITQTKAT